MSRLPVVFESALPLAGETVVRSEVYMPTHPRRTFSAKAMFPILKSDLEHSLWLKKKLMFNSFFFPLVFLQLQFSAQFFFSVKVAFPVSAAWPCYNVLLYSI